jgi:exopolysaccharide biosynthesis protein
LNGRKILLGAILTLFSGFAFAHQVEAADVYYEIKTKTTLSKGVVYEASQAMTDAGLLDTYVLRVTLEDPNIKMLPAESVKEYGLRETVSQLLEGTGAIAGTNGSFFGMNSSYSASFGTIVKERKLVSASADTNIEKNEFATLVINEGMSPYISFIDTEIHFYNDGVENIKVHSINKVTDMVYPIVLTTAAMPDTKQLDARFPGMLKVVVRNGQISYVSAKGETVQVPEDGYAVLIQEASADYFSQFFKAGQSASLSISPSGIDYNKVLASFGGGGLLLLNGEPVSEGTAVSGRQPRSAIGINYDKTELILAVIDGRSHSVGVTHWEAASIMKRLGSYQAMHLDGGGSSTMVVKDSISGEYKTVNTPSEGTARKVIDAVGIYAAAPIGPLYSIEAVSPASAVISQYPFKLAVYGLDEYGRKVDLNEDEVNIFFDDPGRWENGLYIPFGTGYIDYTATYNGLAANGRVFVEGIYELAPSVSEIKALPGERVSISFSAKGSEGRKFEIPYGVSASVSSSELGYMEGSDFVASREGSGFISCSVGGVNAYIPVYVGRKSDSPESGESVFPEMLEPVPVGQKYSDPWQSALGDAPAEGEFDITAVGNTMWMPKAEGDEKPENYSSIQDNIISNLKANATRVLYIGQTEFPLDIGVGVYKWEKGYAAHRQSGIAILQLTASNGGLFSANPEQWRRFSPDVEEMNPSAVIVELDLNPLNFTNAKEFELFHKALLQFYEKGREVAVISVQGYETTSLVKDGIRYINLGRLWREGQFNPAFGQLRMRFNGNNLRYELRRG